MPTDVLDSSTSQKNQKFALQGTRLVTAAGFKKIKNLRFLRPDAFWAAKRVLFEVIFI